MRFVADYFSSWLKTIWRFFWNPFGRNEWIKKKQLKK